MSLVEHLKSRHLDLDLHRPALNESERVVTFPLWNLSGQMVGYQQYRPDAGKVRNNDPKESRYFTYRRKTDMTAFGVETLHRPGPVFLTEGLFDAARMTKHGFAAVASLSNDPPREFANWLWCLNRHVVAVCDNDAAGQKLAKFGTSFVVCDGHDLNDAPDSYVKLLLEKYGLTFNPLCLE